MTGSKEQGQPKEKRVALVTGATGAIGQAIAKGLAAAPGFRVVLLGRHEVKTRRTAEEIVQATGNENVRYELADLSLWADIAALAERWQGPLHVLVNNAGAAPHARLETPEGIECQFATNVLGYCRMIWAFQDILARSSPARVVNVASYWAGDLDLNDLEFRRRRYNNGQAYRQSKQANRMLTIAFARRLEPLGITVNVCHPGDVNSRLSNDLGFGGSETPEQGADTPVWLATSPAGQEHTGKYFEHRWMTTDRFAGDEAQIEALYEACAGYEG